MRRKKFALSTRMLRWFFCSILMAQLGLINPATAQSNAEIVQAKVGDTAIFTWSYAQYLGRATLERITLGTLDPSKTLINRILALKQKNGKPMVNPNIEPEYKGRVAFTVDESSQTVQFSLKDVKNIDNGKYFGIDVVTSESMHILGKMLEIVEPPQFTMKPPATKEVTEGEKVTLDCAASGKPNADIKWNAVGSTLVLSSGVTTKPLIFTSINKTDNGEFICTASNVAGTVTQSVKITVNYLPEIDAKKSSKTLYSYVNNPNAVTLKCAANGRPEPSYYWKNNFDIVVSKTSVLTLKNPAKAQLGVSYRCFAQNKVGDSKPHFVRVERLDRPGMVAARVLKTTSSSLQILWTLPKNTGGGSLTEIIIKKMDVSGNFAIRRFSPDKTNATYTNLKPFTDYSFHLTVKNQLLESALFKLDGKTAEAAPSAPTNFRIDEVTPDVTRQLTVKWLEPSEKNGIIRNYEVAFDSKDQNYNIKNAEKRMLPSNTTSAVLAGLRPYHNYAIQVRAYTVSPGPWTPMLTKRTASEAPSAPRNVTVRVLGAHKVRLTWEAPEDLHGPIDKLQAKMKISSKKDGLWQSRIPLLVKNPDQRSGIIGNTENDRLMAFTEYKIQVCESFGLDVKCGPYSEEVPFRTPEGKPSTPKDFKVTHRTKESISLSWQRPDEINGVLTHFLIFYENSSRRYEARVDRDLANHTFYHQLLNLKLGTKYTVMLKAYTAAGGGSSTTALETSTEYLAVKAPRKQPDDEISAGPIIGGIFSFLVILVLLIILILFIARKQKRNQKKAEDSPTAERRLLPPPAEEKVPDLVTTNGKMPIVAQNSLEEKLMQERSFISSRPIKLAELKEVCDRLHINKDAGFIQEFKSIKRETDLTSEISHRAENKCKNRYNNIVAYDHSRVILSYIENVPGSDYINANYIDGYNKQKKFIATQGPVQASFNDFWRMVWEQNSHIIVMVTNLIEKSRIKCQKYWPTSDAQQYGSIKVTPEEEMELADYVIRKFSVSMVTGSKKHEARKVTQYQFTGWPDHGVPQYATGLLQFIRRIRVSIKEDSGPLICHCSAGVGRSGTFITLDAMLDQIKNESVVDVHAYITHIRMQRNYMVQTENQYAFIYDALLELVIVGDTEIVVKDLPARIRDLERINPDTNQSLLLEEFERLSYNLEENHIYEAGFLEVNASKNRFPEIVPIESTRLKLWPFPNMEGSDYINANFVDGYQQREAFILTQAPMENTVEDFWRMIWEYEVFTIVMLSSAEESDSTHCFPYWPADGEPANIGLLLVQIAAEEDRQGFVKRDFRVTNSKTGETRVVTHFMFYDWPEDSSPADSTYVIDMIKQMERTQQMTGNGSMAVHCSDGCGRSGTICAIMFCIERLKLEGVVDVFQTVRLMRTQRPHAIRDPEHYLFCYNAVKTFVDKFSDYANFK